jgi:tryptophan-rich sensory protein
MNAFGQELDAIRDRVIGSLGASDTRYIRRVAAAVRWFGVGGRSLLFRAAFSPLLWAPLLWPAAIALIAAAVLTVPIVVAAWNTRTWAGAILLPYNVWVALAASLSVGYALRN